MKGSVTVRMAAPREQVWDLVTDVTRIGEFSPETFEAEWLGGAAGPAVGARFRGHVKRNGIGPVYWTTCEVITCDRPSEFAFVVLAGRQIVNTWRYGIDPTSDDPGATDVTESYELSGSPMLAAYRMVFGRWRDRTNRNGMRATLARIKAAVETAPTV